MKKESKIRQFSTTNKEYVSVRHGCVRFIESYQVLSSCIDKLATSFIDIKHEPLKIFKDQIPDNDFIIRMIQLKWKNSNFF